jgi:acyl-CoA reductase-like NAD-dependent aldehyde dehydrogenase
MTYTNYQMYIAGQWTESESGKRFESYSPVTGESLGSVPEGTRADVQRAIKAANKSWRSWAKHTAFERAAVMERAAQIVHERRDKLAQLLTLEQGKPLHSEAYVEVDEVIDYLKMTAADVVRLEGHIVPSKNPDMRAYVTRVPRGVVGAISPWNWPYTMPTELIVPALAVGNAVVWACAPSTSICAVKLAECLIDAGLPSGLLNLITGPGAVVGDEIAVNPDVHALGFIGSVATGHTVAKQGAGKELLLEMGGNGPLIILEDANLDKAVEATLLGSFLCSGQSCTAAELLLVHENVKDAFVEKLLAATREKIRLGNPLDNATTLGPLQNEATVTKMDAHIADAVSKGAKVLLGGKRAENYPTKLYYEATVLENVRNDMLVAKEETFGPVVPIQTIKTPEEAVEITNNSGYGLTVAVFTENLKRGLKMAEELRSGTVVINNSTNWFEYHIAFGGGAGSKSGFGRVGGRFGLERFTEYKTIFTDLS